jgi:hypothetical protein
MAGHQGYTNEELAEDRLRLVNYILGLHANFSGMEKVEMIGKNGWTHPWRYFDALMNYLVLTCFDLLGQPAEWIPFSEWLESSKKKGERDAALASLAAEASPIEIAKHLNSAYQLIYGVKNSFNKFVLDMLNDAERENLYHSIYIITAKRHDNPLVSLQSDGEITEEKKKWEALFKLRNNFTHSAINIGSPGGGLSKDYYEPFIYDGVPQKSYQEIWRDVKKEKVIIYHVADWPFVPIRCIEGVLSRRKLIVKPQ